MTESASQSKLTSDSHTVRRAWSVTDPAWWVTGLVAIVIAGIVQRMLPGNPDDLAHYAAGGPLASLLLVTAYWRLRLHAHWLEAVGLGVSMFAVILAVGWLKGWLQPPAI